MYIANLEKEVDDKMLRKEFSKFGKISSTKVIHKNGRDRTGHGFVCFSSCKAAANAIAEMNGRVIVSKPLHVALAHNKDLRKAGLTALRMQSMAAAVAVGRA